MKGVDLSLLQGTLLKLGIHNRPLAAIGGFHNGGLVIAKAIKKKGCKIVALSDEFSGIVDIGGNGGLNVGELSKSRKEGKVFSELITKDIRKTKPEFLLKMEVDILVPEGKAEVLNKDNAYDVRAKIVLLINEGQITKEAEQILKEKLVSILPVYS